MKNTHSVTKTEISVFGRQALDAERRRSPSLADKLESVNEKTLLVHYCHKYYIIHSRFSYSIRLELCMCLYQCWSSRDSKLFTDGNVFQLFIILLLKQCFNPSYFYILVSPVSHSHLWFLLMGHISATHYLRHTQ